SVAGSYTAAATTVRVFYSHYATDPAVLIGPVGGLGAVTVTSIGDPGVPVLDVSGATLSPAARTLSSLDLEDGTLRASGDLTVTGNAFVHRYGAQLSATAVVAVGGPATLTALGGADMNCTLDGYSLAVPAGHAATLSNFVVLLGGARVENA